MAGLDGNVTLTVSLQGWFLTRGRDDLFSDLLNPEMQYANFSLKGGPKTATHFYFGITSVIQHRF